MENRLRTLPDPHAVLSVKSRNHHHGSAIPHLPALRRAYGDQELLATHRDSGKWWSGVVVAEQVER